MGSVVFLSDRTLEAVRARRRTIEADEVRALRRALGLSQSALGEVLGVQADTVRKWEQGKRHPVGAAKGHLLRLQNQVAERAIRRERA